MGTYDVRNGCFKCVSVRTATVDEKNHGQQHAEATNELLKQMTRHLPEQWFQIVWCIDRYFTGPENGI